MPSKVRDTMYCSNSNFILLSSYYFCFGSYTKLGDERMSWWLMLATVFLMVLICTRIWCIPLDKDHFSSSQKDGLIVYHLHCPFPFPFFLSIPPKRNVLNFLMLVSGYYHIIPQIMETGLLLFHLVRGISYVRSLLSIQVTYTAYDLISIMFCLNVGRGIQP